VRVDNVTIRQIDNRIFHKFGTDHLIRETTFRESSYDSLKIVGNFKL
jgi:hypothetical protein